MVLERESLNKELVFLLLQYLNDKEFRESAHNLERESGIFFNMKHCEELVLGGKWDEVEAYISGFTKMNANRYSTKLFFEIRKQKYLEALDRDDHASAVSILRNDLKVFEPMIKDAVFQEMTNLLTLNDIRQHGQLSLYRDANETRKLLTVDVVRLIKANPDFNGKLQFPASGEDRLQILLEQSLKFQHSFCQNPMQNPDPSRISLFRDHECAHCAFLPVAASHQSIGTAPNVEGSTNPTVANGSFQSSYTALLSTSTPTSYLTDSRGNIGLGASTSQDAKLKGIAESDDIPRIWPLGNFDQSSWEPAVRQFGRTTEGWKYAARRHFDIQGYPTDLWGIDPSAGPSNTSQDAHFVPGQSYIYQDATFAPGLSNLPPEDCSGDYHSTMPTQPYHNLGNDEDDNG